MGNAAASLSVRLESDATVALAGRTLKGRVTVEILSAVSGESTADFDLFVIVQGKEKSVIREYTSAGSRAENFLYYIRSVLHNFEKGSLGSLEPGNHDFPFELDLPDSLPSSMRCESGKSSCEIKYKVKAELRRRNVASTSSLPRTLGKLEREQLRLQGGYVDAECEVLVMAAPRQPEVVPWFMEPVTRQIKSFGLVGKGFVSLGAKLPDTHVSKGDPISVQFVCCNSSIGVEIEYMEMTVWEILEWTVPGSISRQRSIRRRLAKERVNDLNVPAAKFNNFDVVGIDSTVDQDLVHDRNRQEIYIGLGLERNKYQIAVPEDTSDTYKGQIVKCFHCLEIMIKTTALVENPKIEIPLRIHTYEDQDQSPVEAKRESEIPCFSVRSRRYTLKHAPQPVDEEDEKNEDEGDLDEAAAAVPTNLQSQVSSGYQSEGGRRGLRRSAFERSFSITSLHVMPLAKEVSALSLASDVAEETMEVDEDVVVRLDEDDALVGGTEVFRTSESALDSDDSFAITEEPDDKELVEQVPPEASIENLLKEMLLSTDDYTIVSKKLQDPDWKLLLVGIGHEDFGAIVAHVNLDFDQPKVAELIATQLSAESSFTCAFCKEALRNTADWNRITMLQRLLPFCSDLQTHRELITEELTPWELTVTANDFAANLSTTEQLYVFSSLNGCNSR